jgi:nitronate monooxygenase
MAPMFLVSNNPMVKAAIEAGIMGVVPTLNYRNTGLLKEALSEFRMVASAFKGSGSYGVNLIVQKTNIHYKTHLEVCVDEKVPFYITSLGNPAEVIAAAHSYGAKVYCDVTNLAHAEKCAVLGCDGFIAVGQGAGGHAGPHPLTVLIPALRKRYPAVPVVAAGGIASGAGIISALALGASGVSMGTLFIASLEASVSDAYKQAVVDAGMEDIVMTERLSGTPCSVIDTPFSRQLGTRQTVFERILSNNSLTKKYFKMLVQLRGMKRLEKAIKPGNYNNLWSAGKSAEMVDEVRSVSDIVKKLRMEMHHTVKAICESNNI